MNPLRYNGLMTKQERLEREKEQRKNHILDKAQELIFNRGFSDTTIGDIAKESGYTKRTIYLYLKDRDEIYYSIVFRGQLLLKEALHKAEEERVERGDTIGIFSNAFFKFSLSHTYFFNLIMNYESERHSYIAGKGPESSIKEKCQNISVEYGEIVQRVIQEDLDKGIFNSSMTAKQLMLLLWGQLLGVTRMLYNRKENFREVYNISQEEFFENFVDSLRKLYYFG